jgi:uncharacterized protein YbaR (Trm112 family)
VHGPADNIPAMLQNLMAAPNLPQDWRHPLWFPLWDSLLHQGVVSAPAYAVVPHLVALAYLRPPQERLGLLNFIGCTTCCVGEKVPTDLMADYRQAYRECRRLILQTLAAEKWSYADTVNLLADLAAVYEQRIYGRTLSRLADGELEACCPFCKTRAFFGVTESGLEPSPVQSPDFPMLISSKTISLDLLNEDSWDEVTAPAFLAYLSESQGQRGLAKQIAHLSGEVICSSCNSKYSLVRAVDWYWISQDVFGGSGC